MQALKVLEAMPQLASPLFPPFLPSVQTLKVLEAMPPLEELAKYNAAGQDGEGGGGGGDLSSLMASLPADSSLPKAKFNKGDKVWGGRQARGGDTRGEGQRGILCPPPCIVPFMPSCHLPRG